LHATLFHLGGDRLETGHHSSELLVGEHARAREATRVGDGSANVVLARARSTSTLALRRSMASEKRALKSAAQVFCLLTAPIRQRVAERFDAFVPRPETAIILHHSFSSPWRMAKSVMRVT